MRQLFCLLLFPLTLSAQNKDISHLSSGGKLNPLQAIMDIRHYTISLDVDINNQSISGYTEIELRLSKRTDTLLFDLINHYTVGTITVNNTTTPFDHKNDKLYLSSRNGFEAGRQLVKIFYSGKPPIAVRPPWFGGFTFTKDRSGNPWVAINCQKEGARIYFPCKDHPSDEPNEGVDMFITVPDNLVVAGPGLLEGVKKPPMGEPFTGRPTIPSAVIPPCSILVSILWRLMNTPPLTVTKCLSSILYSKKIRRR